MSYISCVELLVVGNTNATDILIQGLEKLEYRGYDSAGLCPRWCGKSQSSVGRPQLSAKTAVLREQPVSDIRVGRLTETEATRHHIALTPNVLSLVHNGVIENYLEIKEEYLTRSPLQGAKQIRNHVHLIGKFAEEDGLSFLKPSKPFTSSGSYAFALIGL